METLASVLRRRAEEHPDRPAVICEDEVISHGLLLERVLRAAGRLARLNVGPGDRVLLSAASAPDFIYAYLGTHWLGAAVVPLDAQVAEPTLRFINGQVQPKAAFLARCPSGFSAGSITEISRDPAAWEGPCRAQPDDLADLIFTTGTTGRPKGVMLTHRNIMAAATNINAFIGNTHDDRELLPLPLSHSFGLGRLRCNLLAGGTLILCDGLFNLRRLFNLFERLRPTGFASVPAGFAMLLRLTGEKLAACAEYLRYVEIGSAPMPREHKQRLMQLLPRTRLCMHYGLTEASRAAFLEFHADGAHLDSVGRPSPNVTVRVATAGGAEAAAGEEGEIQIRGGMVMRGYWRSEELTRAALAGDWLHTGDTGRRDEQGYLFLSGRASELINVGGRKVSPVEVEGVLATHPAVAECACAGVTDPEGIAGQVVRAYLVARGGAPRPGPHEWPVFLHGRIEPYKFPREFVWVSEIPKTSSGKIQRQRLADAQPV